MENGEIEKLRRSQTFQLSISNFPFKNPFHFYLFTSIFFLVISQLVTHLKKHEISSNRQSTFY